jgi:hypothetical protein
MKHEVTIISDDLRFETGNKITLAGLYDEAMVFKSLPSRVLKLAFYQRWSEFTDIKKVTIVIKGSAIGAELRSNARPLHPAAQATKRSRILASVGPIDFLNSGTLEFLTFVNDESKPSYSHAIDVRVDPNLNIEGWVTEK